MARPIQFPRLGVVRRLQNIVDGQRDGYPTPWSLNVRLEDSLTGRLRGGSFEGAVPSSAAAARSAGGDTGYLLLQGSGYLVLEDASLVLITGAGAPDSTDADSYYRARLLRVEDHLIFASRLGDSTDWNYDVDVSDTARATVFQLAETGETGDDIVALVPHKDSFLLCFTATETWVLTGDPTTGRLRNVSREVGIVGPRAWCKNHDTVYFLSERGLYEVGADGSGLQALSENILPEDLIAVDDDEVILDYNHASRGVSIHQRYKPSWFYDTSREGFWPFDVTTDQSHLLIGPLRLGSFDRRGLIQTLHGVMAEGSDPVTWHILTADTAEEVADNGKAAITAAVDGNDYSSYVKAAGSWNAGRSYTERPRQSGMFACIWLASEGEWAFEGLTLNVVPAGKWR